MQITLLEKSNKNFHFSLVQALSLKRVDHGGILSKKHDIVESYLIIIMLCFFSVKTSQIMT